MKPQFLLCVSLLVLFGCGHKPTAADFPPDMKAVPVGPVTRVGANANGDSVTPIGPNIGPMTPVAGGDNLGGGTGGGLGQRAKDMARGAASQSSSAPTATGDDAGE